MVLMWYLYAPISVEEEAMPAWALRRLESGRHMGKIVISFD